MIRFTHDGQTEQQKTNKGKKRPMLLLVPALAVAIGFGTIIGAGGPTPFVKAAETVSVERGLITVAGKGEIKVAPDVAYINAGVETKAATAKEAQAKNAAQFAAIEKLLFTTYKLDKKDVKTTGFYVQPQYQYNEKDGTSKIIGYTATHSIEITSRNLDGIGALLDNLSTAGANRVDGVRFDVENQEQYELQAMEKAMAQAKRKADVLAKAGGRAVKQVVNITQGDVASVPIFQTAKIMAESAADSAGGSSVQTGEVTVSTSVTVSYEMQ
ncbi:SIMPL domain-containing protein [Paenibacillus methanolicus]|uniref:SIMPL domain-containing protein n=1 Tax=Paenibacillus methanolicus TaxID=582686 RepID=A0A5S5BSM8_9BACL|nr:SIMPL domain-containing protein [Paenibacillus methanolicus]TYP69192.1 hypothetical protein BCM02_11670 [Paenibacillus methanolicus]